VLSCVSCGGASVRWMRPLKVRLFFNNSQSRISSTLLPVGPDAWSRWRRRGSAGAVCECERLASEANVACWRALRVTVLLLCGWWSGCCVGCAGVKTASAQRRFAWPWVLECEPVLCGCRRQSYRVK